MADSRHVELEPYYSFFALHGGRDGGQDNSIVEVSYGNRAVPGGRRTEGGRFKIIAEAGPTLLYQQNISGVVICSLYPARAEGYNRIEDGIILALLKDPIVLLRESVVTAHWRAFMSYFEVSSLDGEPTFVDRIRILWVMFVRPVVVKGVVKRRRYIEIGQSIVSWALTVGLAGAILEVLQSALGHHHQ
jgi:hypothetical protein